MNDVRPNELPPPLSSTAWTPTERESFFDAIARHRRAAWQVHIVAFVASAVVALIVALMLSPLFYAALALIMDLANLIVPTANLVDVVGNYVGPIFDAPEKASAAQWLQLVFIAALPGLAFLAGTVFVMRRAIEMSGMLDGATFKTFEPDALTLEEQRFRNVAAEMAVSAGIPQTRILIADWSSNNAAVFGAGEGRAVIVVARGVIETLTRARLQAVMAHLIGSIANGDMEIGVRVSTTTGLFSVNARLGTAFTDRKNLARLMRTFFTAAFRPSPGAARAFIDEVADPFRSDPDETPKQASNGPHEWRNFLWMPFAGPIFASGFFGGIISLFGLEPLVSLSWRRRKYLADATAVRLTRDPDALCEALRELGGGDASTPLGAWGAHLCVVRPVVRKGGMFGTSAVPPYPSIDRRLRALVTLGASSAPAPKQVPLKLLAIIIPLVLIVAMLLAMALGLLVWLSAALSALFLGLPFGAIHALLRAFGHG